MGSADWMPRNLDKRVEILFPVEDETLKEEIIHILDIQFADNVKARVMQSDGTYIIPPRKIGQKKLCAQQYFCKEAIANTNEKKHQRSATYNTSFEPLLHIDDEEK